MTPLLLTLAIFAIFSVVGLATLAAVRADTGQLRIILTAPALGSALILVPVFLLSDAGLAVESFATPVVIVLLLAAVGVIGYRRPRVPLSALPVIAVCAGSLLLAAQPMLQLGFHWLGNGNDDMANYTLSAQQLLHHGLLAGIDPSGLLHGTDYATVTTTLHRSGSRPGPDLMLAVLSAMTNRFPYEVFMPLIFAFNLCTIGAAGALAMQATNERWAATVAAALLAISPLATFGVLQQLFGQVWGLALGTALFALLMRPELHRRGVRVVTDGIPIGILAVGLVIAYVELASALAAAYLLYVVVLAARKELSPRVTAILWATIGVFLVVVLNRYLPTELKYVKGQASSGVGGGGGIPLFGYALVPGALPGIVGLQQLRPLIIAPHLQLSIAVAGVLLIGALAGCVVIFRRGVAAGVTLVALAALALLLAVNASDFGLYKLYMYVQPFLAAAVAVWLASTRGAIRWSLAIIVLLIIPAQLSTQHAYIARSEEPIELPHASAEGMFPQFKYILARTSGPIVSESENPTLTKLQAEISRGRPILFLGTNAFPFKYGPTKERRVIKARVANREFDLLSHQGRGVDAFEEVLGVSQVLANPQCELVIPTGSQIVINRRSLPNGLPYLVGRKCGSVSDLLAFVSSELGESYYGYNRRYVSFYQPEGDPFFPGQKFAGFGRYTLFRVLGPVHGARLEVNLTTSLRHDGSNVLPPAAAVGTTRASLPLVGRGSARVFSPPVSYQSVNGASYLLLDLGAEGQLNKYSQPGLAHLYGSSVVQDPRFLTAYVRSVSLINETEYRQVRPPEALERFPADLGNRNLVYSGIYEDGWVGEDSYAVLAAGPATDFTLRALVPEHAGKHLEVLVNGHVIASMPIAPGRLVLQVPVTSSAVPRRVELRFALATRLKAPDLRPASALLSFLGFAAATKRA